MANLIFSEMINNNGVVIESTTGNTDVSIPFCPLPSSKLFCIFSFKERELGSSDDVWLFGKALVRKIKSWMIDISHERALGTDRKSFESLSDDRTISQGRCWLLPAITTKSHSSMTLAFVEPVRRERYGAEQLSG